MSKCREGDVMLNWWSTVRLNVRQKSKKKYPKVMERFVSLPFEVELVKTVMQNMKIAQIE